jgi:malate:Na+ symporter
MSTEQSDPGNGGAIRWPQGWWRVMEVRIGIIPLPVHLLLFAAVGYFLAAGTMPTEINVMIAVLAVLGFSCAELGKRIPLLKDIGGGAIFATFLPSCLVFYHVIPAPLVTAVTNFTKSTNFLYLFIACIVVGSILGMDRTVLIKGFLKIFVPLAAGSLAAIAVGTLVGTALGLGARHALLFVVLPIMAGGVGEGAIPLSLGYADILHQPQSALFAQVLPPVMVGSLTAILLSGALNFLGKRMPRLTGEGRLQPGEHNDMDPRQEQITGSMDVSHIAAAGMTAMALYLLGLIVYRLFGVPAAVAMLFLAVFAKLTQAVSPQIQQGAYVVYQFFARAVTYPLLFAIGVALTPWDKLLAALALPNLITIVATVTTLIGTGFVVGRWVDLFPIDAAIVTACHSGQGGTGDVAILTAANRMQLMPFAQIATRIGGAITVLLTLLILARTV